MTKKPIKNENMKEFSKYSHLQNNPYQINLIYRKY